MRRTPTLVLMAVFAGCHKKPDAVAADLQRLCTSITEVNQHTYADGFARSDAVGRAIAASVREAETRRFFGTLASEGPGTQREQALREFADKHGLPNWHCAGFDQP